MHGIENNSLTVANRSESARSLMRIYLQALASLWHANAWGCAQVWLQQLLWPMAAPKIANGNSAAEMKEGVEGLFVENA